MQFLLEKTPAKWSFGEIWEKKHEDPKKIPKKRPRRSRGLFLGIIFGSECFFAKNCSSCHSRGWAQKPQGTKLHELPFTRMSLKTTRHKIARVAIHEDKPKKHEAQPSAFLAYPSEWQRVQFYAEWFLGSSEWMATSAILSKFHTEWRHVARVFYY